MKTISMTAYNRPDYLKRTLEDIEKNNPAEWTLFVSVDPSDRLEEIKQVLEHTYGFSSTVIVVNPQRKDHRRNQHDAIAMAFGAGSTFNLHFDDDLFISPDALELASYYERTYKDKPLTFGSYGLFNYASTPDNPTKLVTRPGTFTGLGWCIFRHNWEQIFDPNWFNDVFSTKFFRPSYGWDWNIAGFYKEFNISEIFPTYSRTNHAGREHGTCCNQAFYDATFTTIAWNKDLIVKDYTL
ncbi:glycosyltransferase [bacterium]|nr:glycosyltransferase [bacterium]